MATSKRFRTLINGLMVEAYVPKGAEARDEAVLFLPGFPYSIGENSVMNLFLDCGYTIYFLQYPGTYDSQGEFTPPNAIDAVSHVTAAIGSGRLYDLKKDGLIDVPSKLVTVIGYSFGAFVTARSKLPETVTRALFISPALTYGSGPENCGFLAEGVDFVAYVSRSRPITFRLGPQSVWREFYRGKYDTPLQDGASGIRAVLTILGDADDSFDLSTFKANFPTFLSRWSSHQIIPQIELVRGGHHSISELIGPGEEGLIKEFIR